MHQNRQMNSVKFYLSLFSILFLFCGLKVNAQAPTVTSFSPTSAAVGATVTITGTNFTGATAVRFGGTNATSFTVNSATQISAVVGQGTNGSVSVTSSGGTGSRTGFTIATPTISSFSPTSAATGQSVIITGTNLTGATIVRFGGTNATSFTINSATQITAVVGAGSNGSIQVTTPGGTATRAGFTIAAPTITSFTPSTQSSGGNVVITGTNLTGATAVKFGPTNASSFTINSITQITATVGGGSSGFITVTTSGGTASSSPSSFTFPPPTITSLSASFASAGTSITITGTNFLNSGTKSVQFTNATYGTRFTSYTYISATQVSVLIPEAIVGAATVNVVTDAGTSAQTVDFNVINSFTGASSTDWNTATNWSSGNPPQTTEDATIPSGLTNNPVLSSGTTINNLVLNGTLSLNDNTLTIDNAITGTGTFISTASSVLELNGTGGTINFDASNNSLLNLTINSNVTLGNSLNLYGILYPNSGTLTTGGNLILKSSSGSQGVVAAVGGTISGTVTTERFIPQNATFRAFRDLCPVVANAGSVFTNWQEGGVNNNGYGVQITGISGPWDMVDPVKGFDISKAGNGSMQTYNGTWSYATNTKTMNLDPAQGYRLLIRGNRSFTLFPVSQPSGMNSDATLRTTGNLVTGTVTYTTSGTSSTGGFSSSYGLNSGSTAFSFIGNPYASTVSWSNLINDIDGTHTSGISGSYYYLDPTLLDGSNASTYVTYNGFSNTSSGGSVGDDILPGQAIFVRNEGGGSPQVVFKESYKTTGNFPSLVFGTTKPVNKVVLQLFKNNRQIDGATLVFKSSFSKAIGKEDSKKLMNTGESLTFSESGNQLCIDGLSLPNSSDTISLQLSKMVVNTNYKIKFNTLLFDGKGMDAYVYDSYLNKKTFVNQDSLVLDFSTTTDSASYFNRFSVVFGANPLPIESINLSTALQSSNSVLVKWSTVNKSSVVNYTLQRSIDGHNFSDINRIAANKASHYSYTDSKAFNGINYYRVKAEDKVGVSTYSSISTIVVGKKSESVIVYPNPVINKSFNIKINNFASGNFTINVLNALGQSVQTKRGTNNSGAFDETINFNTLASGLYFVKVSASNGQTYQKEISIK